MNMQMLEAMFVQMKRGREKKRRKKGQKVEEVSLMNES